MKHFSRRFLIVFLLTIISSTAFSGIKLERNKQGITLKTEYLQGNVIEASDIDGYWNLRVNNDELMVIEVADLKNCHGIVAIAFNVENETRFVDAIYLPPTQMFKGVFILFDIPIGRDTFTATLIQNDHGSYDGIVQSRHGKKIPATFERLHKQTQLKPKSILTSFNALFRKTNGTLYIKDPSQAVVFGETIKDPSSASTYSCYSLQETDNKGRRTILTHGLYYPIRGNKRGIKLSIPMRTVDGKVSFISDDFISHNIKGDPFHLSFTNHEFGASIDFIEK